MDETNNRSNVDLFRELFTLTAQTVFRSINLSELHITNIEIMTMMTVYSHSGISMSHLAEAIGISSAQLSRTVSKLEEHELVVRRHNPDNRRIVNVFHTAKGSAIVEQQTAHIQDAIAGQLDALTPDERQDLTGSFTNVIRLLAKAGIVQADPQHTMDAHLFRDNLPSEKTENTLPQM